MIIGHEVIRSRLRRMALSGHAAHFYVFTGPESVGKRVVALEFASVFHGELDFSSGNEADILSRITFIHPEIVEKKGKVREVSIGVETIRESIRMLGLSSRSDAWNILVVDNAHRLSESAQNSFLKTLEEPFPRTVIIFITHEEGSLLHTIISRSERVVFSLVPEDILRGAFSECPEIVFRLGRPGVAVSFRNGKESFDETFLILNRLLSFSLLSFEERFSLLTLFLDNLPSAERLFSLWISGIHAELISAESVEKRRQTLVFLHAVSTTLRDIRKFPGDAHMTLEHLFLFGKSVSPLLARNLS